MAPLKILVSGASIAGSTTAYWLAKGGARVTVIERAPSLRTAGQGIDVEGPALDVIKRMGLEEEVRRAGTNEAGITYVDEQGKQFATFDTEDKGNNVGFTSEIEIMRGDLAGLLFGAADALAGVEYRFGTTIKSLDQRGDGVRVHFSKGAEEDFDIVVGAEGLGSPTRGLILPESNTAACYFSLGGYVGYFSVPREPQDAPRSRFYQTVGRRSILIRPRNETISSVYLGVIQDTAELKEASSAGVVAQKELLTKMFQDVQYPELKRVLRGMEEADDFYFQHVAQVRLEHWYAGRGVLVGDAAYAPSPFSGQGTPLAIQGAYVLAGEISSSPAEPDVAFRKYEEKMKPFVKTAQSLSMDGLTPKLLNPESAWGLWVLRNIVWIVANSGVLRLGAFVRWLTARGEERRIQLPDYNFHGEII
ncbi:MAG: hypothetical protein M4579_005179 [Chaenotheca gracillima]|nr:MAG: hypothetical protein M4579_005179 [Chaenotheca gracillima]